MSSIFLSTSNTSPLTTKSLTSFPPHIPSTSQCITFKTRDIPLPISVTSPSISYPYPHPQPEPVPSFDVDYLQSKFGTHGVSFTEIGGSYVVKMVMENGSAASLLLPSGLITSYKPKMWHGSSVEVLHTSVSEGDTARGDGGGPVIQGGVSVTLDCVNDDDGFSWSPSSWILSDVIGSSQDTIQAVMISRDSRKMVEVKYAITLKEDTLCSEINVSNLKSSQIFLTGSILSHLTVSTPDATYAFGLEGSNFFNRAPLVSDFCMIPPNLAKNKETGSNRLVPLPSLKGLFFSAKRDKQEIREETTGEENDNYKHLTDQISRIYTSAPRNFTIIDRGKRNSVIVGRKGFEELYLYSPGSSHEHYGKYAYVCVGQSAILKPIILAPEQLWRGEQKLHNPNI